MAAMSLIHEETHVPHGIHFYCVVSGAYRYSAETKTVQKGLVVCKIERFCWRAEPISIGPLKPAHTLNVESAGFSHRISKCQTSVLDFNIYLKGFKIVVRLHFKKCKIFKVHRRK